VAGESLGRERPPLVLIVHACARRQRTLVAHSQQPGEAGKQPYAQNGAYDAHARDDAHARYLGCV
jgi:hypothetical protein